MRRTAVWLVVLVGVLAFSLTQPAAAEAAPSAWGGGGCSQWYTVSWGENLFRIALRFGTTVGHLQALNGLPNPNYVQWGSTICVRGYAPWHPPVVQHGYYYRVCWGDTLYSIARRFGVGVYTLMAYNHIPNGNYIYAGQVIYIP